MKKIPPPCPEPESGRKYWRSLDQLTETAEFRQWVEREFPAGASEFKSHGVVVTNTSFTPARDNTAAISVFGANMLGKSFALWIASSI